MNSAYSIFKSPTSLDKRQGFSGSVFERFQGRVDYTPNLAQEINLSRIQRRINVDRVSIRHENLQGSQSNCGRIAEAAEGAPEPVVSDTDSGKPLMGVRIPLRPTCKAQTLREVKRGVRARLLSPNADSYSRCFRYLDCFNGGSGRLDYSSQQHAVRGLSKPDRADAASRSTFKAVYLSSQLDRKTDCFDGGPCVS